MPNIPPDSEPDSTPGFAPGELALLVDRKDRRYLIRLAPGEEFHTHAGVLLHDHILATAAGSEVRASSGSRFVAHHPTLADYILKMPRGAQIIYPKDIGAILMLADIAPGQKILETGVGSGALSLALLRLGVEIVGYDLNEKFAERAQANVAGFLGAEALERYTVKIHDSYTGIPDQGFDRVLLDLPEPWQVVPHLAQAARNGALALAYSPSAIQVSQFCEACEAAGFVELETLEVMHRGWHVKGSAVRPNHRMVAHTGFLTRARIVHGS